MAFPIISIDRQNLIKMQVGIDMNLRVTAHASQGGRHHMEDMFCVNYQETADRQDILYAFFGIFDGHGGDQAALFAKQHLMDNIVSQDNFWSENDQLVLQAIKTGFIVTHHSMWKESRKWPKSLSGHTSTAGTTASVAFLRGKKLYIGHVGDSGIVLGCQDPGKEHWYAKPLTKDHKPEDWTERARIIESGGNVVDSGSGARVVWTKLPPDHQGPVRRSTKMTEQPFLAVARSLGDFWSYNSLLGRFTVSPEPDVSVIELDTKVHRCLFLYSDGVSNIMLPHVALDSVYYAEKHNDDQLANGPLDTAEIKNWINPSKRVVDRALGEWDTRGLRADNTSVVTVVIDPPGPPKALAKYWELNQNHNKN
jgi:protein phosphatase 1D